MRATVIINPVAGLRGGLSAADRLRLAATTLASREVCADVVLTERPGHALEIARSAVGRGASLIYAWGGDGTINEVGRALAFGPAALGIIPAGSGNGLARALGIPRRPQAALLHALDRPARTIDAGEIDGHLFLNVAGVGFDAHVAHAFARVGGRRGFRRYLAITARGLLTYEAPGCRVCTEGSERSCRALLLTIANGPQWGNGALIAPDARLDDGLLDLVTVEPSSRLRTVLQTPRLFTGTIARAAGVSITRVTSVRITGEPPLLYHADGEPLASASGSIDVSVLPKAVRIRA